MNTTLAVFEFDLNLNGLNIVHTSFLNNSMLIGWGGWDRTTELSGPKPDAFPLGYTPIFMEQMTGIEPAYSAWQADVLPLNYICM